MVNNRSDLMVDTLDPRLSGPSLSLVWGHYFVFLNTLLSQSVFPPIGGSPAMYYTVILPPISQTTQFFKRIFVSLEVGKIGIPLYTRLAVLHMYM